VDKNGKDNPERWQKMAEMNLKYGKNKDLWDLY